MTDTSKPPTSGPATITGDPQSEATIVSGAATGRPPARLGRYSLLERLGVGGMAEVYLAEQVGAAGFHKKVVVKRILPHLAADTQFVQMFVREAKVAARVSHPNVVQIFELAEEGGEIFIAMEHIDGLTLHRLAAAAWEQGRALPIDVVIRTIADAANGLHAAHSLKDELDRSVNLVHRDVSPDNLMVSKDGVTKVLDFGIAKGDLGGPKTKTGNLRGKIPFMPPEQIKGEVLDGRADIYALGVSAYWMLTGERPFDRQSDWHTMHAILNDEPVRPSTHNAAVPPALDALLLRMLQKDREKRPGSAKEVADSLEELASASSVGGKKTTIAFLSEVLPTTFSRGNPVSEIKPTAMPRPPDVSGGVAGSQPAVPWSSPPSALVAPSPSSQFDAGLLGEVRSTIPFIPETAITPETAPTPSSSPSLPSPPPPSPPSPVPAPAVRVVEKTGEEKPIVKPVTMPSGPNAISDILSPRPRSSAAPFIAVGLIAVVVLVGVVVLVVIPRIAAGSNADAGVNVADAGLRVDAGTPTVLVRPPPVEMVSIDSRGPARIRWKAGDVVVGLGEAKFTVPKTQKSLLAEDLRRGFSTEVPIVDGVADYNAVPSGTVIIVRKGEGILISLGQDDISTQRKLTLPVGRYRFKVVSSRGVAKETTIEVAAGKQHTLDAGK